MYLVDANVLIRANADFYPLDRIPQFWEWLIGMGNQDLVKVPHEIRQEILRGDDPLTAWISQPDVRDALLLDESSDPALVQRALDNGYQRQAPDFTDGELHKIGNDAFLVAYGMVDPMRIVATREVSKPSKRLGARKLPDACEDCGVNWTTDYEMYRLLNFNLNKR